MGYKLLENNRQRLINNPLLDRTPEELDGDVRRFYERCGLNHVVDVEIMIRGARVARDPRTNTSPQTVPGMTPAEQEALKKEKESGFLAQTKELKVAILTTACAAIVQGWQQSTINSSALGWADTFGLNVRFATDKQNLDGNDLLLFGFINAAPPLFGGIIGTWISDPLQEHVFGRRPAIFVAAVFSLVSVIGSAYTRNWEQLLLCRALLGVGMGAKASIAPVLAAEVAVDHLRGSLTMSWQLFDAFGIFLGFACALAIQNWRILVATALIPAVPLMFLVFICPESPRFLMRKNRYKEAYQSLRHLRETELQACRDLYAAHSQLQMETELFQTRKGRRTDADENGVAEEEQWYNRNLYQEQIAKTSYLQRIWRLFTIARNRRAALSAFTVMAVQILSGYNVLVFYSSTLPFDSDPGKSLAKSAWVSFGFGFANFLFTLPAYKRIDHRGRRFLLLLSLAGTFVFSLPVGFSFQAESESVRIGLVVFFIICFTFFYSIGSGPVPFTLSAEVFPLAFREVGMSFSVMINFLGLGLLLTFVPSLTYAFGHGNNDDGHTNLLGFFCALNALSFIMVFLLVPSTAKPKLEEMNYIFGVPTWQHVKFQLFIMLPWVVKRILRQTDEEEPEFMTLARDAHTQRAEQRHSEVIQMEYADGPPTAPPAPVQPARAHFDGLSPSEQQTWHRPNWE